MVLDARHLGPAATRLFVCRASVRGGFGPPCVPAWVLARPSRASRLPLRSSRAAAAPRRRLPSCPDSGPPGWLCSASRSPSPTSRAPRWLCSASRSPGPTSRAYGWLWRLRSASGSKHGAAGAHRYPVLASAASQSFGWSRCPDPVIGRRRVQCARAFRRPFERRVLWRVELRRIRGRASALSRWWFWPLGGSGFDARALPAFGLARRRVQERPARGCGSAPSRPASQLMLWRGPVAEPARYRTY
jgi:hypothetical protein